MAKYFRLFGLGSKTFVRLNNEARGLVPTSQWKRRRFGVPWQKGEDLVIAIGQGFLLATPIQAAVLYGAIANGGELVRPRVVSRVEDATGRLLQRVDPEIVRRFRLKPGTISFLQEALKGVVQDPTGTGRASRLPDISVAGKTGTAQVIRAPEEEQEKQDESMVPYKFRDHAWFIAYAPTESPEIVVAVLVEHGGHGGSTAAPLARQVMEEYFRNKPPVQEVRRAGVME